VTAANPKNEKLSVNVTVKDHHVRIDLPDGLAAGSSVTVPLP
jgi:hypothetical protein